MHDTIMHGALRSPEDSNDLIYERMVQSPHTLEYVNLPSQYEIEICLPKDQQKRGTCGAFVGATIQENAHKLPMSPEFIYCNRNNRPHPGMFGRDVFQILKSTGSVPEKDFPYMKYDNMVVPKQEHLSIAEKYKINNYARITTPEGLKKALYELGPCYLGLPLYNFTERFYDSSIGNVVSGGHAVTAVGYNEEGFIILNSWGDKWADSGKSVLKYEDFNLIWEIWVSL